MLPNITSAGPARPFFSIALIAFAQQLVALVYSSSVMSSGSFLSPISRDLGVLEQNARREWRDVLVASQTFNVTFLKFLTTVRNSIGFAKSLRIVTNHDWAASMFPYLREFGCLTKPGWNSFVQLIDACHFLSNLLSSDVVAKLLAITSLRNLLGKPKKLLFVEIMDLLERLVADHAIEETPTVKQALLYLRSHSSKEPRKLENVNGASSVVFLNPCRLVHVCIFLT